MLVWSSQQIPAKANNLSYLILFIVVVQVVEMLLTVQRQWMYLENIFLGEDIRRQLPRESAEFDEVNANWKTIMTRLNKTKNALRGTHHEGMLVL